MEFLIEGPILKSSLDKARKSIKKEPTKDIMKNMLIEAKGDRVSIISTDATKTVVAECLADVKVPGACAVMGIDFHKLVKKLPLSEDVSIKLAKNNWCHIRCGSVRSKVAGIDPKDFPDIRSTIMKSFGMSICGSSLNHLMRKTVFCSDNKETRPGLCGVFLKLDRSESKVVTMATNGHRLAICKVGDDKISEIDQDMEPVLSKGVIIPADAVEDLMSFISTDNVMPVDIYRFSTHGICFSQPGWRLAVQTIQANFPDFTRVLPDKCEHYVKFSTSAMLKSISRVSLFAEDDSNRVRLRIKKGVATLEATNKGRGEVEDMLDVEFDGDELLMAYQVQYLKDAVKHVDTEDVVFGIINSKQPTFVREPEDDDTTLVVMPMRV